MQNKEYFKKYYSENKERINARNKARYESDKKDPERKKRRTISATISTKKYRLKNKEKCSEYSRKRHLERKIIALKKISNGKAVCVSCGCDFVDVLEINHINGGGCKEHKKIKRSLRDVIINGKRNTHDLNVKCRVCNALDYVERKNKECASRYVIKFTGRDDVTLESTGQKYINLLKKQEE